MFIVYNTFEDLIQSKCFRVKPAHFGKMLLHFHTIQLQGSWFWYIRIK